MLLRRKIDPKAGRREVRERITKLLMAVTTTSSTKKNKLFFSSNNRGFKKWGGTRMTHEQNVQRCLNDPIPQS